MHFSTNAMKIRHFRLCFQYIVPFNATWEVLQNNMLGQCQVLQGRYKGIAPDCFAFGCIACDWIGCVMEWGGNCAKFKNCNCNII